MKTRSHLMGLALLCVLRSAEGQSENLVSNGGFESGSAGWDGEGKIVADQPHAGTACLQVSDTSSTASTVAFTHALMPIRHGQSYQLSVWIRAVAAGQKSLVTLEQYDSGGNWIPNDNYDFVATAGPGWTEFRQLVRAFNPATAAPSPPPQVTRPRPIPRLPRTARRCSASCRTA